MVSLTNAAVTLGDLINDVDTRTTAYGINMKGVEANPARHMTVMNNIIVNHTPPPMDRSGFREVWQDPEVPTRQLARKHDGSTWRTRDGGQSWTRADEVPRHAPIKDAKPVGGHRIDWMPGLAAGWYTISKFTGDAWSAIRSRLLHGDPDWEEFKRRWATEFGPIGDEKTP